MPSNQKKKKKKKLRNYSVEDKQWLVKKVTEQLPLSDLKKAA